MEANQQNKSRNTTIGLHFDLICLRHHKVSTVTIMQTNTAMTMIKRYIVEL